jgi:hypothetical protein
MYIKNKYLFCLANHQSNTKINKANQKQHTQEQQQGGEQGITPREKT